MSNKLLLNLSNSFRTSKQNKLSVIEVKLSKKTLSVICVLLREGLIRGYFLKNKHTICVLIKYIDDNNIIDFKNISLVKQRMYYSNHDIKQNFMSFNCSLISTRRGLLSHKEAVNKRLGGFPLFNFF